MANEIIGAFLQVIVFSLIPLIVFLLTTKKFKGFFDYVGLKKSNNKANLYAILVSLIFLVPSVALTFVSDEVRQIMLDPTTVTGKFREMGFGFSSVVILLMMAVFKTSFAEEVLFRGFLAKRLISWLGYQKGNILQALLFAALHVLIFLSITKNPFFLGGIMVAITIGAYLMVYLNEKMADGSIIPGWIAHGLANVLSYSIIGFLMV